MQSRAHVARRWSMSLLNGRKEEPNPARRESTLSPTPSNPFPTPAPCSTNKHPTLTSFCVPSRNPWLQSRSFCCISTPGRSHPRLAHATHASSLGATLSGLPDPPKSYHNIRVLVDPREQSKFVTRWTAQHYGKTAEEERTQRRNRRVFPLASYEFRCDVQQSCEVVKWLDVPGVDQ